MWRMAIKYLIFLPIIVLSFAQDTTPLFQLYNERKMEALKNQLPLFKETPEKLFFETLFVNDADSSIELYKQIYDDASEKLKPLIARKLYEYYYAKGFYITAQRYSQDEAPSAYEIQLGAFISQENAEELEQKLSQGGLKTYLVIKEINQKKFYCVRIKGKDNLQATKAFAEDIEKRFNLKYRIIK
jgi:hypothetical protein